MIFLRWFEERLMRQFSFRQMWPFRSTCGRQFSKTMADLKLNDKEGQSVEVTVNDFCCLIFQNKVPEGKGGVFCLTFGFFKSLIFVRKTDRRLRWLRVRPYKNCSWSASVHLVYTLDQNPLDQCRSFTQIQNLKRMQN